MTMPTGLMKNTYLGDGSTGDYDWSFLLLAAADILVTITDPDGNDTELDLGVHYSVGAAGIGDKSGGTISLIETGADYTDGSGNLETGYTITLLSNRSSQQSQSIRNSGEFYRATLENAMDELVIYIKQLEEKMARALQASPGSGLSNVTILNAVAGYVLAWNDDATAIKSVAPSGAATKVRGEVPSGTIDNSNVTFTLAHTPSSGTLAVYKNGRRVTNYSLSTATITFNAALGYGADLIVDYDY